MEKGIGMDEEKIRKHVAKSFEESMNRVEDRDHPHLA